MDAATEITIDAERIAKSTIDLRENKPLIAKPPNLMLKKLSNGLRIQKYNMKTNTIGDKEESSDDDDNSREAKS
jgi:hypothetical protein